VSAVRSNGQTIFVADAHRNGQRFVVRADEKLTAFMELESQLSRSVLLRFCKSERNTFPGGSVTAFDGGQRSAKRIHL
jgi:hypothetical protein